MRIGLMALLLGCGGVGDTTAEGTVGGEPMDVGAAFWGGPFIVLAASDYDCLDMAWVNRYYEEEDPPLDEDLTAVQFTFTDSDVVEGTYSIAGEAALTVRFLTIRDGIFNIEKGRSGELQIDEMTKQDVANGSYDVTFDSGSLKGSLSLPFCTNMG